MRGMFGISTFIVLHLMKKRRQRPVKNRAIPYILYDALSGLFEEYSLCRREALKGRYTLKTGEALLNLL